MNNDELKSRVGANIARLRRERGLTQAELAERINYSDKAVSKWERAESLPDVLTLLSLAEQLDTDLNTLVGMSANPKTEPVSEPESPAPEKPVKKRRTYVNLIDFARNGLRFCVWRRPAFVIGAPWRAFCGTIRKPRPSVALWPRGGQRGQGMEGLDGGGAG
jgi:transcriptional regulator with XRE-family HTH domain